MEAAEKQYHAHRVFAFEHPASATSWELPEVQQVAQLPEVHRVLFDQCMVGLKSKVEKIQCVSVL